LYLSTHVNYTEGSYRILSTRVYKDLRKIGNGFITNGGPDGVQKGRLHVAKRADVARAAGVAESTISYALSGSRPISEETKSRILKAMKDLDYKPNAVAAALRSGSSKMLALVFGVTDKGITQGDISYLLGAADAARELGYHLILWPARDRDIDDVIAQAQSGLLDGVVLMEVRLEDARVKLFRKLGIPVGLIGRTSKPEKDIYADRDFDGAVRLAIEELVRLGHKKIDYLSTTVSQAEEGFGAIVRAENLAIHIAKEHKVKLNILHCEISVEAGVDLAGTYLKKNNCGTAIVSINSEAIAGFSRAIQNAGKKVPEDISIICIDSSEREAVAQAPALTTISPPAAEIGSAAVTSLIKNLANLDIEDPQQLWRGDLVTRGSTGPAPK
jgi:DNA-binding LacI/PurR family transcriptional regulator